MPRSHLTQTIKRIVVKVGTSSLTYPNGTMHFSQMERLVRQLAELTHQGYDIILVTSGAIGAGVGLLGLEGRPESLAQKQACAAIGQLHLMHLYEKFFSEYGKKVGQILLSKDDIQNKKRSLNAQNAFESLLDYGAIPIVNENDAVVVDEIKVGDNDTLSAHVAKLVNADLLILLSDIDGLFTANPKIQPDAKCMLEVIDINEDILALAGSSSSKLGTGGMSTKLSAGQIVNRAGIHMLIANSFTPQILTRLLEGEALGTWFLARASEWDVNIQKRGGRLND